MRHCKKMVLWVIGVVLIGMTLNGCAELIIKDEDDGAAMIGKVMYRTVFAIGTLGYSEVKMAELTGEFEREQQLRAYEARVLQFLEKGEITQSEARHMILKEKARLWDQEGKENQESESVDDNRNELKGS